MKVRWQLYLGVGVRPAPEDYRHHHNDDHGDADSQQGQKQDCLEHILIKHRAKASIAATDCVV